METYDVDALIGAFMFCRREALLASGGFDTDFSCTEKISISVTE
jgi:hypothetical protein